MNRYETPFYLSGDEIFYEGRAIATLHSWVWPSLRERIGDDLDGLFYDDDETED